MNDETKSKIERHVYGHDSIRDQLLDEFLSKEEIHALRQSVFEEFADILQQDGVLGLEAIDRRLQLIIDRAAEGYDEAVAEITRIESRAASVAMWPESLYTKEQREKAIEALRAELNAAVDHKRRLIKTEAFALFRKEVLRAVMHRYVLFGDSSTTPADGANTWRTTRRDTHKEILRHIKALLEDGI